MINTGGKLWITLMMALLGTACGPSFRSVTLRIQLPERDLSLKKSSVTLPSSVTGFDCYAVNIFGPDIPGDLTGDGSTQVPPAGCSYLGIGSGLITSTQDAIVLKVPSGPARTIQVIGIATGTGCPTSSLRDYLKSLKTQYPTGTLPISMLELGKKQVDLFKDTLVQIDNTYTGPTTSTNRFPFQCPGTTAPGTLLPLAAGFSGTASATGFPDSRPASLPPASMTAIPTNDLNLLANPVNTTPVYITSSSYPAYARLDLVFDAGSINLSNFTTLRVEGTFAGGNSASGCATPQTLINGTEGAEIRVGNPGTGLWSVSPNLALTVTPAPTLTAFVFSGSPPANLASLFSTGTPTGKFVQISLRAMNPSASNCTTLIVHNVRVGVIP